LDFELLTDGDVLGNQFPGLTFQNATVLSAGISLNEFEFPPRSGSNVIFDDGGPITITFSNAILTVEAYLTYSAPLTLTFYDVQDNVIASLSSVFSSNLAQSGESGSMPNEPLRFSGPLIAKVVLVGDSFGSSFTLDDLTMQQVPEPTTTWLVAAAFCAVWRRLLVVNSKRTV
jgi:hypothetical protein